MKSNEISSSIITGVKAISQKENPLKLLKEKVGNGKKSFLKSSLKFKDNISTNIHKKADETNGFFDSVKNRNTKMNNLENCIGVDKSCLVSSDKSTSVYKPSYGKLVIVDKDIMGEPYCVTVKEFSNALIYTVKYDHYTPYVYPNFDEREISGKQFYLDKTQIWYKDADKITILYKVAHSMHSLIIKMKDISGVTDDNIESCVKNYFTIINSPRIKKLVDDNNVNCSDIVRLKDEYLLTKNQKSGYSVFVYDFQEEKYTRYDFFKLPNIELDTFDIIFKPDIFSFILKNKYPIESFEQKNGYIECNEYLGKNKVCVFRYKI